MPTKLSWIQPRLFIGKWDLLTKKTYKVSVKKKSVKFSKVPHLYMWRCSQCYHALVVDLISLTFYLLEKVQVIVKIVQPQLKILRILIVQTSKFRRKWLYRKECPIVVDRQSNQEVTIMFHPTASKEYKVETNLHQFSPMNNKRCLLFWICLSLQVSFKKQHKARF